MPREFPYPRQNFSFTVVITANWLTITLSTSLIRGSYLHKLLIDANSFLVQLIVVKAVNSFDFIDHLMKGPSQNSMVHAIILFLYLPKELLFLY